MLAFADYIEHEASNDIWSHLVDKKLEFKLAGTNYRVTCADSYMRAIELAKRIRKGCKRKDLMGESLPCKNWLKPQRIYLKPVKEVKPLSKVTLDRAFINHALKNVSFS